MEIKLSPIKQVSVSSLKNNPLNERFFGSTSGAETDQLYRDIKERVIMVPLIAKKCGVLLAGHRRLNIASQLKLKTVPVQYASRDLTDEEEKSFIVRDNVLRRHLSPDERRTLYRFLVPGFEEKIKNRNSATMGVNTREIAEKTGLNPRTVGYDIVRIRREKEKERLNGSAVDPVNEKEIAIFKKHVARMLNVASLGSASTLEEFKSLVALAKHRLDALNFKESGK